MKQFTHNCDNDKKTKFKIVNKRKRKINILSTTSTNNDNVNKKRKFNGNISNLTKLPGIHKNLSNWYNLPKFIQVTTSVKDRQDLLQRSLSLISKLHKEEFDNIETEVKIQKRAHNTAIKNIDEQIFALAKTKKKMKIDICEFNKNANAKMNEFASNKTFIDQVLIKYRESINNNNDDEILTKELISVVQKYSQEIPDFDQKILSEKLKSTLPLLEPATPLNPKQTYGIPKDIYKHNHNQKVLKNYREGQKYPNTMSSKEVLEKYSECDTLVDYRDLDGRFVEAEVAEIGYDNKYQTTKFGMKFPGWDSKYYVYSYIKMHHQRFAEHKSISTRIRHRACMEYINLDPNGPWGDFLEVKPLHIYYYYKNKEYVQQNVQQKKAICTTNKDYHQYLQWHVAKVILTDYKINDNKRIFNSAQVKCILYKYCIESNKWIEPKYCQKEMKWLGDIYWVHLDNEQECAPINKNLYFDGNQ